jgi:hypothetical protein
MIGTIAYALNRAFRAAHVREERVGTLTAAFEISASLQSIYHDEWDEEWFMTTVVTGKNPRKGS